MSNTALSEAIKEAYASCPSDIFIYHTLEIKHSDFVDDDGNPTTIRLVQGFKNITAKLENGEKVEFLAMCFDLELPPVDTSAVPEISIEIDNVSREIIKHLDNAASSQHKTELIYRPYLSTDLDTPQMVPPVSLTVTEVSGAGNMKLDKNSVVLSGHGMAAKVLERVQVGDRVRLRETLGNETADEAELVVGAGPSLVVEGKADVRSAEENIAYDIARGRAPRTAAGVKKDGTVILLVVDGRSSSSAGMTLQELASYLVKLGAWQAVNFDGGGSSEMVLDGKILNTPSDGRERPVSVGLGVFPTKG